MTAGGVLVRLEYLTPRGWEKGHAGIKLLDPGRYVERLSANGKFGRAIELDDLLQPTGTVWAPEKLPNPADLVPSSTRIPKLADTARCPYCAEQHRPPYDGGCLI